MTQAVTERASVRVEWVEIPTYVPGPPDPYPAYPFAPNWGRYPYAGNRDFSTEARPVKHRVVVLENRYVRATVLPDLGGRLYSLYDKVAAQETFLVPPSMKFQNISVGGLWLAGGVEFNFGHTGHTVTTCRPVSWATREHADGSASVWVGATLMPTESRWAVRIVLAAERAAVDLEIHTFAPPVLPGLMYWWTNAGVEVSDQSRFFYFGRSADSIWARHSWPICDGRDFRWYRNRLAGSDMFLIDPQRDYIGFYDYARRHGLAQTADRFDAPGQKYFTWGTDHGGLFHALLFSDTQQRYVEIQRGRSPTQFQTAPLPAMTAERWTETWMPIRGTEGFSACESDLVLSVTPEAEGGAARLRLLSAVPRRRLRCQAGDGEETLASWTIDRIDPQAPFAAEVPLAEGRRCTRVSVTDEAGKALLDWSEYVFPEEDWHRARDWRFDEKGAGLEELFLEAQRRRFLTWPLPAPEAAGLYEKVLAADPGHTGSLRALAEAALFQGRWAAALGHVEKALSRVPDDAALLVLRGWSLLRLGRGEEAAGAFAAAARCDAGRRAGLVGLAAAHIRRRDLPRAAAAVDRLLAGNPADPWGRRLRAMLLRKADQREQALELLEGLLAEDPLCPWLNAEAMLLGSPAAGGTGQPVPDAPATAALPYIELGCLEDACGVLECDSGGDPLSPAVRLAHLAYVQHRLGDDRAEAATLARLDDAPVEGATPWATASIDVLTDLVARHGDSARLHAMLGSLLASRERCDEALDEWRRAVELGLEHTIVHRDLAALLAVRGRKEEALDHYRRAWGLGGGNPYLFGEFDGFLATLGRHGERSAMYEALPPSARQRSLVATARVGQLLDLGRYDEAAEELTTRWFFQREAGTLLRLCYVEAHVGMALPLLAAGECGRAEAVLARALEYPRNINTGRGKHWPNEAMIHYFRGLAAAGAGDASAAGAHWRSAIDEQTLSGHPNQAYQMLALRAAGVGPRGEALMHELEQRARGELPTSREARWFLWDGSAELVLGLTHLAKGHVRRAGEIWAKALADNPAARLLRLHASMPAAVLERMARASAAAGG